MDVLFFIAIAIILGFIGGKFSNKVGFPGVIGYLVIGLLLGPSCAKIFDSELLEELGIINDIALAIVAFIIGSEMLLNTLRKLGKSIIAIILFESFGAFTLVAIGVYLLTHKLHIALIFGALAPASAPAGTVAVLQEYRAKGPLTKALYAVVGLDDGLAIIIYAFAAALAKLFLTGGEISFLKVLESCSTEVFLAILLGAAIGFGLGHFLQKLHREEEVLAVTIGGIFLCTGLAKYLHVSLILSNLSLGMTFANSFRQANRRAHRTIQRITLPIFIVFFLMAGAHLQIKLLPSMGILGLIYIVSRTAGLMGGAWCGAAVSKAPSVFRRYLGFGILSQAGVAIGLAILVTREFGDLGQMGRYLSLIVINTIAATTIIFEIIGPIGAKFAISRAGEIGKSKP